MSKLNVPRKTLAASSLALALGLAGTWLVLRMVNTTPGHSVAVSPASPLGTVSTSDIATADVRNDAVAEPEITITLEARLREYWGPDWERIRAALVADGVDLQVAYDFPEWEQVAQGFENMFRMNDAELEGQRASRLGWPKELTAQWLAENFSDVDVTRISAVELAEIETLTAEDNHRLNQIFDSYIDEFGAAMESAWRSGDFLKAPFSTAGLERTREGRAFFASARAYSGWGVKYHLYAEDHPSLLETMAQMRELRRQRDRTVRKYLRSL